MDHFTYKDGRLHAEDIDLDAVANAVGTPFYCYSVRTLQRHYRVFKAAFEGLDNLVCYAVKANSNQAVLKVLADAGAGADVVSIGELKRALKAGIAPSKIVFAGVGKTTEEMQAAIEAGICQFNVESEPELNVLSEVAVSMGQVAPVSVRVNPDVDAKTHAKISTGNAENKFGISWGQVPGIYARIAALPGVEAVGVDMHIGSQLTDLEPLKLAFTKLVGLVKQLRSDGHDIRNIDLGGGLGIPYDPAEETPPSPNAYGALVREQLAGIDARIILEPGRLIAGNAGVLVSKVVYIKEGDARRFVILDAAMNDLMRPAMYGAYHAIVPLKEPVGDTPSWVADYVGPVCESSDTFAEQRLGHALVSGDLVALKSAGAYSAVMANSYNSRALVPEVMVMGNKFTVIRPREEVDAIIAKDIVPDWL